MYPIQLNLGSLCFTHPSFLSSTALHKKRSCFCICVPQSPLGGWGREALLCGQMRGGVQHGTQCQYQHMLPPTVPATLTPSQSDIDVVRIELELPQYHRRYTMWGSARHAVNCPELTENRLRKPSHPPTWGEVLHDLSQRSHLLCINVLI